MMKSVFFDLDGTLTDPFVGITTCIQFALRELDVEVVPADELKWCIGPPLMQSLAQLVGKGRAAKALEIFRERFSRIGWKENEAYPGVSDTLARLQSAGMPLYVATSKPRVYAIRIIEHFQLGQYFKVIYGSELDGTRCNKSELLAYALSDSGTRDNVVMIGDREHDMIGALENGIQAIGVAYGYGSRTELIQAGADRVVDHPEELVSALL